MIKNFYATHLIKLNYTILFIFMCQYNSAGVSVRKIWKLQLLWNIDTTSLSNTQVLFILTFFTNHHPKQISQWSKHITDHRLLWSFDTILSSNTLVFFVTKSTMILDKFLIGPNECFFNNSSEILTKCFIWIEVFL